MPPRKKPNAAAAKPVSQSRHHISKQRQAVEGDTAFSRPSPPETMAPGEDNDGRTHGKDNMASPRDSVKGHARRFGEKSAVTGKMIRPFCITISIS